MTPGDGCAHLAGFRDFGNFTKTAHAQWQVATTPPQLKPVL